MKSKCKYFAKGFTLSNLFLNQILGLFSKLTVCRQSNGQDRRKIKVEMSMKHE